MYFNPIELNLPNLSSIDKDLIMSNTINDKVTVSEIAHAIAKDWAKPSPYALDYLNAMKSIRSVEEDYYADSAKSVILYFLANASTYRGDNARAYKALLKEMIK